MLLLLLLVLFFFPGRWGQILIANNGMAGTKAILSMRQWCYLELGDEKAVEFVAMATPEVGRRGWVM